MTQCRRVATLLGLLLALGTPALAFAQAEDNPLNARLGSTTESFEAQYGEPKEPEEGVPALFTEYDLPGYSTVFADSYEGFVESIALYSPRPEGEEWDNEEPHDLDWSLTKAHDLAERFLPLDAELEEPADERLGVIRTVGYSPALAAQVPESVYAYVDNEYAVGQLSYVLMLNADKTGVNAIRVELLVENPLSEA